MVNVITKMLDGQEISEEDRSMPELRSMFFFYSYIERSEYTFVKSIFLP